MSGATDLQLSLNTETLLDFLNIFKTVQTYEMYYKT